MAYTQHSGRMTKLKGQAASLAPGVILAVLMAARPAGAADECGVDGPGADTLTCPGGAYLNGITYEDSDGLTLILDDPTLTAEGGSGDVVTVQSNTTTSEDVVIIARQFDTVLLQTNGEVGINAVNRGFGRAEVQLESGVIRKSDSNDRNFGISAVIANPLNSSDAFTHISGGLIETAAEFGVASNTSMSGSGTARALMTGGTIRTTGRNSAGLAGSTFSVGGTGSVSIRMSGGDISTLGDGGFLGGLSPHGIYALTTTLGDASIFMDGGSVSTSGVHAYGILSDLEFGLGPIIGGTNTISAHLAGGAVSTQGDNSHGMVARTFLTTSAADARARIDNGTITVGGAETVGMFADNWGRGLSEAIMTGGVITNSGLNGKGIMARVRDRASGQVARVAVSGGTINTTGAGGYAIHLRSEIDAAVELDMTGGTITTTGATAHGVFAERSEFFGDDAIDVSITGGTVTTSGAGAHGVYALNVSEGDTRVLTGTDISAFGEGADAIRVDARVGTFDVDVTAGQVRSDHSNGVAIRTLGAAGGTIAIHADAVIAGAGSGFDIIDGDGSTALQVAGSVQKSIDMGAGDDSATFTSGSLVSGPEILMGEGSDTAIVEGNADLSAVTSLNGDSDDSGTDLGTDRLTVRGSATFEQRLALDGWEVLTVEGTSLNVFSDYDLGSLANEGLFLRDGARFNIHGPNSLTGNVDIAQGSLYQLAPAAVAIGGGAIEINGSVLNAGTLSVQNGQAGGSAQINGDYAGGGVLALDVDFGTANADTLDVRGDVTAPGTVISIADTSTVAASGADITLVTVSGTTSEGDFLLSGGAVTSGAYSYTLNQTGSSWMLTPGFSAAAGAYQSAGFVLGAFAAHAGLIERTSGATMSQGASAGVASARGAWVQASGSRFDLTSAGLAPTSLSGSTQRLQFGYETRAEMDGAGQWVFGLTGQIGSLSASSFNSGGSSRIKADAVGIGATATWYGAGGFYVDTQATVTRLSVDYASNGVTIASGETTLAYGLSVEAGQRIALNSVESITPQIQLSWAHVSGQRFMDSQGTFVEVASHDRVIGRMGFTYERRNPRAVGGPSAFYASANILHDFSAGSGAVISGTALDADFGDTWIDIGLGVSKTWDRNKTVYADVAYRRGFDNDSSGISLNAGFKMTW